MAKSSRKVGLCAELGAKRPQLLAERRNLGLEALDARGKAVLGGRPGGGRRGRDGGGRDGGRRDGGGRGGGGRDGGGRDGGRRGGGRRGRGALGGLLLRRA